jgi:hypothetical protein
MFCISFKSSLAIARGIQENRNLILAPLLRFFVSRLVASTEVARCHSDLAVDWL